MTYLILAILCSFSITLLIKHNETHGAQTVVVLASNYLSAAALGWTIVLLQDRGAARYAVSQATWWLGAGGSLLWPGGFFLMMWGIRRYGVSLAGSVTRLSLSVPVLFAALFLHETFTLATVLGIAGAFAAFLLLSPFRERDHGPDRCAKNAVDRHALWYFPVLVLVFGIVDLWVNVQRTLAPDDERFVFVVLIFSGAGLLAWLAVAVRRLRPDWSSILRGLLLGVPNFFSTFLLMEALRAPAFAGLSAVVYAVYSAAGVALAFIAGAVFWQEPLTGWQRTGVVVAVAAVVLLNLR